MSETQTETGNEGRPKEYMWLNMLVSVGVIAAGIAIKWLFFA